MVDILFQQEQHDLKCKYVINKVFLKPSYVVDANNL